jgi:hypothetical protein
MTAHWESVAVAMAQRALFERRGESVPLPLALFLAENVSLYAKPSPASASSEGESPETRGNTLPDCTQ